MKPGDKIIISAPGRGECRGEIDARVQLKDLPAIAGAPGVEEVRAILREGEIVEVMMLSYEPAPGRTLGMCALRTAAGEWRDMHWQRLFIRRA